jgi:hypothetical protein
MSERFAFYNTKLNSQIGRKLHDGDDAMDETEAERVLNDLWNSYKDSIERIAELEKELNLTKDIIVAHQIADETGYIDGVGWVENWSEMEETVTKLVEAHNLVQQSNGCFEAISEINSQFVNGALFVLVRDVNNFGVKKQLQAKALKDKL